MKKIEFLDWTIEIEEGLKSYNDLSSKKLAILSEDEDEIHITLELNDLNKLVMHPRWNINITYIEDKYLSLTTNN